MVNVTELMLQHIDLQTEMGVRLQEILHKGGAIPEELAVKLIEDKINSPEVAHHGECKAFDDLEVGGGGL